MFGNEVIVSDVEVLDDDYTAEKREAWESHMFRSYECIRNEFFENIEKTENLPFKFVVSKLLIRDVVNDAILGMKKMTNCHHDIDHLNGFKIAAYLGYWWLRRKPASIHFQDSFKDDDFKLLKIVFKKGATDDDKIKKAKRVIWLLKHINEFVAAHLVLSYVFDFENEIYSKEEMDKIMHKNNVVEIKRNLYKTLTYYFAYRPISPESIEHFLEAYTLFPLWKSTEPYETN